ncbi:putative claudin-24 [Arapaima gigas]
MRAEQPQKNPQLPAKQTAREKGSEPCSGTMDPGVCALELLGFFLSLAAWLCSLATTIMPQWLTLSTDLLPTESYELGLWETCVVQDLGGMECRPYDSLLGLPPDIKLARILMCLAVAMGLLGVLLPIPGLHLINSCCCDNERSAKRVLKMLGGVFCFLAGALGLVPVSYIAHLTVLRFFDESVPDVVPRWEFGNALFCGWAAGFLQLVAGVLLVTSCLCVQGHHHHPCAARRRPPARAAECSGKRTEYV